MRSRRERNRVARRREGERGGQRRRLYPSDAAGERKGPSRFQKNVVRTRPFGLRLRLKRPLKTTSYITETPPPSSPSSPSRPSPEKDTKGAVAGYTLPLSIYRYRRRRRRPYSDVIYCRSLSWNLRFLNR